MQSSKIFSIIALGFLGDTLLIEPLCRNIKQNFPGSKVVVIVNKAFQDIPLGFDSVDEIYAFDKKNEHKGLMGCLKFVQNFKYKNRTNYAIITHPQERSVVIAKAIGAENIVSLSESKNILNCFINKKVKYVENEIRNTYKADYNLKYTEHLGIDTPPYTAVKYERKDIDYKLIRNKFNLPDSYIVLSPSSKDFVKDWDYNNIKEFINKVNKTVVIVGTEKAQNIAQELESESVRFINLCNKTTISELGAVIHEAEMCISVDTGTFHLSYAQGVKTIGLFFNSKMIEEWAPKNLPYVKIIIGNKIKNKDKINCIKDITANDVINNLF